MRIFKTKWFERYARRHVIRDLALWAAVQRAERGLVDADLGGGLIKQRVAREGEGRSGGYRVLLAYRRGDCAFFLYGFAKSARANLDPNELLTAREIGAAWFTADPVRLQRALSEGELVEATDGGKET